MPLTAGGLGWSSTALAHVLYSRITEAWSACQDGVIDGGADELLERRGRAISEWRQYLQNRRSDYRDIPALQPELAARVLEDASAPLERRIGATIALGAEDVDPELQHRARNLVQAIVDPRLRSALTRELDGEAADTDIEQLLAQHTEP